MVLISVFFQAEDGIRDLTVTGVQTCALPIFGPSTTSVRAARRLRDPSRELSLARCRTEPPRSACQCRNHPRVPCRKAHGRYRDRKSTRLNSSHSQISYAVFCLKKNKTPLRPRSSPVNPIAGPPVLSCTFERTHKAFPTACTFSFSAPTYENSPYHC